MRRLFPDFKLTLHLLRSIGPVAIAAAAILLLRVALPEGESLAASVAEFVLYCALVVGLTIAFERALVRELVGYVRGRRGRTTSGSHASASA